MTIKQKVKLSSEEWNQVKKCVENNMVKLIGLRNSCKEKNMNIQKVKRNIRFHRKILRQIKEQTETENE